MEFVVRAIRMTLSLCHSVAEEHDLIVDVESRPERRRQEHIRALLVMAVESSFEGIRDLRPSGAAAATHRMVIHLNAEIPADHVILRFVERSAPPVRRAELLRRLLVQARRLHTPNAATAPRASPTPATQPPLSNAQHLAREPAVAGQATWVSPFTRRSTRQWGKRRQSASSPKPPSITTHRTRCHRRRAQAEVGRQRRIGDACGGSNRSFILNYPRCG